MKNFLLLFLVSGFFLEAHAQFRHHDYLGAGHDNMVSVTSSSDNGTEGDETVDGFDIENPDQLKDASRFLAQATFGADFATIQMAAAMGYGAWLDEQFTLPILPTSQEMYGIASLAEEANSPEANLYSGWFRSAWFSNNLISPDLLRQRSAFALSQVMVISDNNNGLFQEIGQIIAGYYDMLLDNSFGNYQDLLTDVTYHPGMGAYLTHYSNPKENLELNIRPDENYAREIMQLFSIGLWELNPNGTRKVDSEGQFIPTYTNDDIKEFAQVFTGLSDGRPEGEWEPFDTDMLNEVVKYPMKMYEEYHDNSTKVLLNGVVLPANQPGDDDINQTIAHLGSHPNTAPFICKQLIKRFTTSNPTGTYVQDVASVFNPTAPNNFQEVIRAILLHPEARTCAPTENYTFGKLREPMVRMMNFLKAFHLEANDNDDYPSEMFCALESTGQTPMGAPSVFNFYRPDYSPQGPINQAYMVGPEFQILNAPNAVGLINTIDTRAVLRSYFEEYSCIQDEGFYVDEYEEGGEDYEDEENMDYDVLLDLALDSNEFVDYLDILLANGLLSDTTKSTIINAIDQLQYDDDKIRMAIYLILIAPDYAILK